MWLAGTLTWPCRSVGGLVGFYNAIRLRSPKELCKMPLPLHMNSRPNLCEIHFWLQAKLHRTTPTKKNVTCRCEVGVKNLIWIDCWWFSSKTIYSFGPLGPWVNSTKTVLPTKFSRMTTSSKHVEKSVSLYEMCSRTTCLPSDMINKVVQVSASSRKSRKWDRIASWSFPVLR